MLKFSHTLRYQLNVPRLLMFRVFSKHLDLTRNSPHLLSLKKLTFLKNPSFHFLSLLVLFTTNFQGRLAFFCINFSSTLNENLLLVFPSFIVTAIFAQIPTHPVYVAPLFLHLTICFLQFIRTPVYVTLQSNSYSPVSNVK